MHVTVALRASQRSRKKYEADFLIDTGATDSLVPGPALKRAGIRRAGRITYELADSSTVEYDFGLAVIEFMGELTSSFSALRIASPDWESLLWSRWELPSTRTQGNSAASRQSRSKRCRFWEERQHLK
jgi:hypothetical protein